MKYNRWLRKIAKHPNNAYCRNCHGKLAFDKDHKIFTCIVCNRKIFLEKNRANSYIERDPEPIILEMIQHRIENKFYKLKNGLEYNPVIKKKMIGDEPTLVIEDEHNEYFEEIKNVLSETTIQYDR